MWKRLVEAFDWFLRAKEAVAFTGTAGGAVVIGALSAYVLSPRGIALSILLGAGGGFWLARQVSLWWHHKVVAGPSLLPAVAIQGNNNSTSVGQSGGVTAHSININSLIPNPKLNIVGREVRTEGNITTTTRYVVEIDSPFAVPALRLRISVHGLIEAAAGPVQPRGFLSVTETKGVNWYEMTFQSPSGQYWIQAVAPAGAAADLDYEFP